MFWFPWIALNSPKNSTSCASPIVPTSTSWILSGVRGSPYWCSRLARQLAINLKTPADIHVSLVQLDQLTGLSFHVGSLGKEIETKHRGCVLRKAVLASVLASEPTSVFVRSNRFQLSGENCGPFLQSWLSIKPRALNLREQRSAGFSLDLDFLCAPLLSTGLVLNLAHSICNKWPSPATDPV